MSSNSSVHDLDKMVAQLRAAGIEVKDPESYPNIGRFTRLHGRFTRLHDPEGKPHRIVAAGVGAARQKPRTGRAPIVEEWKFGKAECPGY